MEEKTGHDGARRTALILIFSVIITLIFLAGAIVISLLGGSSAITIFDDGKDDVTIPPMSSYEMELDNGNTLEMVLTSTEEIDVVLVERTLDPPDDNVIESWNDLTSVTIDHDIPYGRTYYLIFKNTDIVPTNVEYQYTYYNEEEISGMFSIPFYCFSGLFIVFIIVDLLLLVKFYIDKRTANG